MLSILVLACLLACLLDNGSLALDSTCASLDGMLSVDLDDQTSLLQGVVTAKRGNDKSSQAGTKKLVVGVGDSIMNGCCCDDGHSKNMYGFMQMLQDRLDDHGYEFKVFAQIGASSLKPGHGKDRPDTEVLKDYSFWNLDVFKQSLKQAPDVVLFMFGTNDVDWVGRGSGGEFNLAKDWEDLVREYMKLPNSPQVITLIPPPSRNWSCPAPELLHSDPFLVRFCSGFAKTTSCLVTCSLPHLIRQFTQNLGLPAPLDLNALNGGPNNTSPLYQWTDSEDALASPSHPTCAGHERIAKHIVQQIFPESQHYMEAVLFPEAHAR